jgi:RimJ/RimL family protein N-acetyltransferase
MARLPEVDRIRTWNAEDNEPMLAVNRRLGFVADAYQREWQKRV